MKAKTTGTLTVIALAVILVAVLVFWRSAAVETAYPVERANRTVCAEIGARLSGIWNGAAAARENLRLRRERDALALRCGDVAALEAENARLRRTLAYRERQTGRWIAAEVLSEGGGAGGARKTLRVDRGTLAGVAPGMIVRTPQGLVGRVRSVTPHTAEIQLVTDASLKVACTLEGHANAYGILSGGTEEKLVLRHLQTGGKVAPRTLVLTSGLGGVFPAGIPVGTLLADNASALSSSRTGEVKPTVDFSALEDVFIRCEN